MDLIGTFSKKFLSRRRFWAWCWN